MEVEIFLFVLEKSKHIVKMCGNFASNPGVYSNFCTCDKNITNIEAIKIIIKYMW